MRLVESYKGREENITSIEIHRLNTFDVWDLYIYITIPQGAIVCGYESYDDAVSFNKVGEECKSTFRLTQDDTSADAIRFSLDCFNIPDVVYEFKGYREE